MADDAKKDGFDRTAYLKEIRGDLLKKLGLPEGTKPQQVEKLLRIKEAMAQIESDKTKVKH